MAKVFISVLGTNPYVDVRYQFNGKKSPLTPFIQEALLALTQDQWTAEDRLVFFLTDEARRKNWEDDGNFEKGLGSRIEGLGISASVETVSFKEGGSEEEIMENFLAIVERLNEKDEVFFDITHSFRSLPMLNLVALNYAGVLKEVKISAIYYGAFEVLGPVFKVREMPESERIAPVFDLTRYAKLLEWSYAVDDFVRYGMVERMKELVMEKTKPILRETRGRDERAKELRKFIENLEGLAMNIYTCRGQKLLGLNWGEKLELPSIDTAFFPAFVPLMKKIEHKIEGFKGAGGLWDKAEAAVEWCIKHSMVQQGYTILEEAVITEVGNLMGLDEIFTCRQDRAFVSQLLSMTAQKRPPEEWEGELADRREYALGWQERGGDSFKRLARDYHRLGEFRNDINHCGFRENARDSQKLLRRLEECFGSIRESLAGLRGELRNE